MSQTGSLPPTERYIYFITCLLAILVVIYVRIRLLPVPLERDEGEFAYVGQLLLKGMNPYSYAYTMKLPGVGIMYAFFMLLFGHTPAGIHLGLLIVNGLCICLVYLLAKRLFSTRAAMFSCTSYAVLSLSQSVIGIYAHATHFVVMFCLAGFNLLLCRQEEKSCSAPLFASGLCFGLSFIMKQHAILLILFALLYLFRLEHKNPTPRGKALLHYSLFLSGVVIPYIFIVIIMLRTGVFARFWLWNVTNAKDYALSLSLYEGLQMFTAEFFPLPAAQPLLWLLAGAGIIAVFQKRVLCLNRFFVFGFLFFSFISIFPGFYFRRHYFILLLPAVSLMAGAAASASERYIQKSHSLRRAIMPLLLIIVIGFGLYNERSYLFYLSPSQISRSLYGANPFPEAVEIARYIQERTAPDDRIAVLGSEPEIYYYANRLSATGYIYMYSLMENKPSAEQMQLEMIKEIERTKPKYIVVVTVHSSWLSRVDSPYLLLNWKERYMHNHYQLVGVADIINPEFTRYLWGEEDSRHYTPVSSEFVKVYKRMDS